MHDEMIEQIAEERGYDRGFTAGTLHAHELLNKHLINLKHKRTVAESEGWIRYDQEYTLQHQINLLEDMKHLIRKGHYE
tara:strand:+ start:422 stop:658 length:237 start_codon:yes stop_codon:yes gene_type:complete